MHSAIDSPEIIYDAVLDPRLTYIQCPGLTVPDRYWYVLMLPVSIYVYCIIVSDLADSVRVADFYFSGARPSFNFMVLGETSAGRSGLMLVSVTVDIKQ